MKRPVADIGDVLVFSAFFDQLFQSGVELQVKDGGRTERGLAAFQIREIVVEIPVVTFVIEGVTIEFRAEEQNGKTRRDVETFLGAGDADVDVQGPHV